jgi:hypothetical protein
MAKHEKEHEERMKREEHMGGKHHSKHHGMGKKEAGFGAKLGRHKGKMSMEGPH